MTIMLQAGFILVLCGSFYQLTSFYANINQVLTARNHAERVISFVDDKIRHAGLGLWRCGSPATIRARLDKISRLRTSQLTPSSPRRGYRLPISLLCKSDGLNVVPEASSPRIDGDALVLLYARSDNDLNMTFTTTTPFNRINDTSGNAAITLIDDDNDNNKSEFVEVTDTSYSNIRRWAVTESIGMPFYVSNINYPNVDVFFYGTDSVRLPETIDIPNAGELMYLDCMQMFVGKDEEMGWQFKFRRLKDDGTEWGATYNQEIGILEIYMELDTTNNIFTLYVLASGGENQGVSYPRPESWPKEANPAGEGATDAAKEADAKAKWLASDYCHHIVYVSRASWKLNNLEGFSWN